jgi:hypothetical protein
MKTPPPFTLFLSIAAVLALPAICAFAQTAPAAAPYKILATTQIPAAGGIDYIAADSVNRRVYSASGNVVSVFDLDTYKLVGSLPNASGHGVALDPENHTGLVSGNPAVFFNTQTLQPIKTVSARGADGYLFDAFTHHFIILSHGAPNLHFFDSKDGSDVGTADAIGPNDSNAAVEQGVTDGQGNLYFDCSSQGTIAVVDAKTFKVTGHYDLGPSGTGPAGLAIDAKNHILFAMCRGAGGRGAPPAGGAAGSGPTCVILSATDGKIITTLPLAGGSDGAVFDPNTMEAFSSSGGGNGTLSIIKENSPTDFVVEDTLTTKSGAKCCTLDTKTDHIIVHTTERAPAPAAPAASAASAPADASATPAPAIASASDAGPAGSDNGGRRGGRGRGPRGPQNLDVIFIGH